MKTNVKFSYLILFCLISSGINAQAFQKGNINFDLGLGLGVYSNNQTTRLAVGSALVEKDTIDGAASTIIPLNFEFLIRLELVLG